ncbi:regulator of G-protein signaling 8 isoform X1 [Apteryx rowi]|uniref:regulator of G-protein signaling 8 isoform X1 n=1 Tax=Apteryx rowi TaxID=308060 RepID=UPI000E1CB037|nr:regulator of G-protein signaling 8 isoform X1 [Apteryx rowi]XP_025940521.1 regulator of G-protein signaling 8 isoform X1 [Apteryx rowi]XP_025940522.1 regulator of G-protein signaling 8 isoform X1 [Apteryx rowi]XP_025940523.1 regulator of G-protein signaling 8 isoform X1 [Apteryx rowi]XP_025940524.1 regulator of G-protein signaling 8 isoform X1 [Apteryx rowi]XP_025940525.1 regulator of G-protein signaling 8 isoform X1 [Apteryx rowi]XP_025940526.1 regulator of G-protein signaling 8 isoform X
MAALLIPRRNRGMRTRLGCLSHKSDSYNDFTAILPDKPNRALKRLSTEEATRWADSFDVLLSHKYGLAAFRAFLKTEFSEENLEFWLACEDFKKTRSATKLASKAQRIFEEFIDVQAPREVNIDFQTRELTRRNMQEPSLSCFDQAQGKVHSLMEKDSYPSSAAGPHMGSSFVVLGTVPKPNTKRLLTTKDITRLSDFLGRNCQLSGKSQEKECPICPVLRCKKSTRPVCYVRYHFSYST